CAPVHDRSVVEGGEPLEVMLDRMIDPAAAFPAVAEVQRGDADVLQEWREIRPGPEGVDAQVGPLARFLAGVRGGRVGNGTELGPLPYGELGFGIFDIARHVVDEILERVRAADVQVPAVVG